MPHSCLICPAPPFHLDGDHRAIGRHSFAAQPFYNHSSSRLLARCYSTSNGRQSNATLCCQRNRNPGYYCHDHGGSLRPQPFHQQWMRSVRMHGGTHKGNFLPYWSHAARSTSCISREDRRILKLLFFESTEGLLSTCSTLLFSCAQGVPALMILFFHRAFPEVGDQHSPFSVDAVRWLSLPTKGW